MTISFRSRRRFLPDGEAMGLPRRERVITSLPQLPTTYILLSLPDLPGTVTTPLGDALLLGAWIMSHAWRRWGDLRL